MNLAITNQSHIDLPVIDPQNDWNDVIEPGDVLNTGDMTLVLILGDKPSVRQQVEQGITVLLKVVRAALERWRDQAQQQDDSLSVYALIHNDGDKSVRCILDDGVTEVTIAPGEEFQAQAKLYIELRELGDVAVDPNQHEA